MNAAPGPAPPRQAPGQIAFLAEFARSMRAVHAICRGRPGHEKLLDSSLRGFVNSFFAFILLLPVLALMCAVQWDIAHNQAFRDIFAPGGFNPVGSFSLFLWTRLAQGLVNFLLFPALMFWLAALMGRRRQYFAFVAGWNWAAVPTGILFLMPFLLFQAVLATPLLVFAMFFFWLLALWILWRVIRVLLQLQWLAAAGVLVLYGALSSLLDVLYSMMMG